MKTVDTYDFSGKRALIRVDFNVPLNEQFEITDDTRIKAAVPTISKILKDGGSVILMSHLGRPKEGPEEKFSLKHLVENLSETFNRKVLLADDCVGEEAFKLSTNLKPGDILLLENLRFYTEETKGDREFSAKLAKHGDVYVNDAFGTAHRAHASTAIVADFFADKICGYLIQAELVNADKVLKNPERPFTAIMGGAKVSDKILLIEQMLDKVDNLIIGGGMSYTFAVAEGGTVGNSLLEADKVDLCKELLNKAKSGRVQLILPVDTVIADDFNNDASRKVVESGFIPDGWMGLDIGPDTIALFSKVIENSKAILWNGPMGVFEFPNFANGTIKIAEAVVKATENGSFSLIGGGDSASAINNLGYGDKVSHVATGGGALLEYMEGKTLPGVAALQ
jgi:phosphoglycerate kinase